MVFRRLSIKRKSVDKNNNGLGGDEKPAKKNWRGSRKRGKSEEEESLSRVSIYATMRRPRKNPMSRAYDTTDNPRENPAGFQSPVDSLSRVAVIHNVENVRLNGRLLNSKGNNSSSQDPKEISFEDGYHTLPARTNPWRTYETDVLNENQNLFSMNNIREYRRRDDVSGSDDDDNDNSDGENIEYNDRKRISSIKCRSKHARYSNPSLKMDDFMSGSIRRERSKSTDKRYVSDFALGGNTNSERKRLNRRRSNEINRSTTLYWDGKEETPTSPETLVFNVSMKANIQTRFKDTILHSAASNGNSDIARFYADSEQYLNAQNGFKNTPLHCAIIGGHQEIIDILLQKNVNLALSNFDGDTALHLAIKHRLDTVVYKLVEMDSSCIDFQNNDGESALHQAVLQSNQNVVTFLIQNGASLFLKTNDGDTPLHLSANLSTSSQKQLLITALNGNSQSSPSEVLTHDHVSKTNELNLSNDSHVSKTSHSEENNCEDCIVNIQNNAGNSLLHCFSSQGSVELVELLLRIPCTKTKLQNTDGDTALHVAGGISNWELMKLLIQEDLELLNIGNANGDTILHAAVQSGHVEIAENLISYGCDIKKRNKAGNTPLHSAIIAEKYDTVKLLLHKAVDLSDRNDSGESVIHLAVKCGNFPIFHTLLDFIQAQRKQLLDLKCQDMIFVHDNSDGINVQGILDVNLQNSFGDSPLHICVRQGNKEMFFALVDYSTINWQLKNNDGDTVLHLIARHNRLDLLHKMNIDDVDTECENNSGFTPWNIAMQNEHSDIALFLLEKRWNLKLEI